MYVYNIMPDVCMLYQTSSVGYCVVIGNYAGLIGTHIHAWASVGDSKLCTRCMAIMNVYIHDNDHKANNRT